MGVVCLAKRDDGEYQLFVALKLIGNGIHGAKFAKLFWRERQIPTVIGRAVRLHPAVVIFALLTGGATFGLLGIVLAVPVAATLRLVLIYVRAKLRDEDPFAPLTEDLAEATDSAPAMEPTGVRSGVRAQP